MTFLVHLLKNEYSTGYSKIDHYLMIMKTKQLEKHTGFRNLEKESGKTRVFNKYFIRDNVYGRLWRVGSGVNNLQYLP
jgi:hypothetical protein